MSNLNVRDCVPCSDELNQYESDIYTNLILWLEKITCIPWSRAYSEAAEINDSGSENTKSQHGTLYIETMDEGVVEHNELVSIGDIEGCFLIKYQGWPTINLSVYNYSDREDLPNRSPMDVLNNIRLLYTIPRINDCLCEKEISILSWGIVSNIVEESQGGLCYRASRSVQFEINRYTSFSEILIDNINVIANNECCDNTEEV